MDRSGIETFLIVEFDTNATVFSRDAYQRARP